MKTEILTAMDNSEFNQILKERLENMKVYEDVSYFEGIKENIIKNPNISIVIINEMIGTKEELIKIIQELKSSKYKIEIIIFLEKEDIEFRQLLTSYEVTKIFLNDQVTIKEIINLIRKDEKIRSNQLENEIKQLKELVFNINKENEEYKLKVCKISIKNRIKKSINTVFNNLEIYKRINIKNKIEKEEGDLENMNKAIIRNYMDQIKKYQENKKVIKMEEAIKKYNATASSRSERSIKIRSEREETLAVLKRIENLLKEIYKI